MEITDEQFKKYFTIMQTVMIAFILIWTVIVTKNYLTQYNECDQFCRENSALFCGVQLAVVNTSPVDLSNFSIEIVKGGNASHFIGGS